MWSILESSGHSVAFRVRCVIVWEREAEDAHFLTFISLHSHVWLRVRLLFGRLFVQFVLNWAVSIDNFTFLDLDLLADVFFPLFVLFGSFGLTQYFFLLFQGGFLILRLLLYHLWRRTSGIYGRLNEFILRDLLGMVRTSLFEVAASVAVEMVMTLAAGLCNYVSLLCLLRVLLLLSQDGVYYLMHQVLFLFRFSSSL